MESWSHAPWAVIRLLGLGVVKKGEKICLLALKAAQQAIEVVGNGELSDVANHIKSFFDRY